MTSHYNVLFLCTGNSTRSIMAEAIMNRKGGQSFTAFSAGSHPSGSVRAEALKQLDAAHLPTKGLRSKSWGRVTGDRETGRLLGAQILGAWGTEISKRVDIFATALFHSMRVDEMDDLDLSYTPPLSSPWDPVQMAAHHWAIAAISEKTETPCRK